MPRDAAPGIEALDERARGGVVMGERDGPMDMAAVLARAHRALEPPTGRPP